MESIPNKYTALQCTQNHPREGSNLQEVFEVQQRDMPDNLQGRECLVEIRAISLGTPDLGALPYMRKGNVPGFDFAGVIRKCNSGMWKEGDRVAGMALGGLAGTLEGGGEIKRYDNQGACATYVRTMCDLVMRIPEHCDFQKAATLPGCLLVAYQSFNLKSWPHNAKSHEPVLVLGADTIVGLCVVQLAHCCGHKVIAVAENTNRKRVEEFGADVFIDRKTDMLPQKIREATQNNLQCSIITTYMDNTLEIVTEAMPNGGEISMNPLILGLFDEAEMNKDRGNVKIIQRTPVTLFGFNAEMNGKMFKPMSDESKNAHKFLQDASRWLQEDRLRLLPYTQAQRQGVEGLEQAMQQIKNDMREFAYKRLVVTISGRQGEMMM